MRLRRSDIRSGTAAATAAHTNHSQSNLAFMISSAKDAFLDVLRNVVFAKVVHASEGKKSSVYGHAVVVHTYKAACRPNVRGSRVFFHTSDQCTAGWKFGPFQLYCSTEPVVGNVIAGWGTHVRGDTRRKRDGDGTKLRRPVLSNWIRGDLLLRLRDELKESKRKRAFAGKEGDAALRKMFSDNDDAEGCLMLGNEDAVYLMARIMLARDLKLQNTEHLRLDAPPQAFIFYLAMMSACPDLLKAHLRHTDGLGVSDKYTLDNLRALMKHMGIKLDTSSQPHLPDHVLYKRVLCTAGTLMGLTRRWTAQGCGVGMGNVPFPMCLPEPLTQEMMDVLLKRPGDFCCIPAPPDQACLRIVFCSRHEHDGSPYVYVVAPVGQKCSMHPCNGEFEFENAQSNSRRRDRNIVDPFNGTMVVLCVTPAAHADAATKFSRVSIIDMTALGGFLMDRKSLTDRLKLASRLVDSGVFQAPCAQRLTVMSASKSLRFPLPDDVWIMPRRGLPKLNTAMIFEHRVHHRIRARLNVRNEWVIDDAASGKMNTCTVNTVRLTDVGVDRVLGVLKGGQISVHSVIHVLKLIKSKDYDGQDSVVGKLLGECSAYATSSKKFVKDAVRAMLFSIKDVGDGHERKQEMTKRKRG